MKGLDYFTEADKQEIATAAAGEVSVPVTSVNGKTGAVTVREVPDVTTADNGKFLRVVNGVWAASAISNANGVNF